MAKFNQNSITKAFGFDNPCVANELVYNQKTFNNFKLTNKETGQPIDLTTATITAQIIRRQISNLEDTRYGLSFDIADYTPTPTPVSLTISHRSDLLGEFTLAIDESAWSVLSSDTQLDINADNCVAFSGSIKISFPANGIVPAQDSIIFLLFLIRSDGIVN